MTPELVAPMVAYLAHEDCPVTGEMYAAGAGRFARMFIATTPGYVHPGRASSIEDVAEHWAAINDEAGYWVPKDLMDWSATFMAHLPDADERPERRPALLLEQVRLLGHDLVVERLELRPAGPVAAGLAGGLLGHVGPDQDGGAGRLGQAAGPGTCAPW